MTARVHGGSNRSSRAARRPASRAAPNATGADIAQVCRGIGSDRRIGSDFLRPGLGYGGSCLPKDVAALRETARRHNLRSDMLLATERVNSRQRCWPFEALQHDIGSRRGLRGLRAGSPRH